MKMQVITESELLEKLKQNLPTLPNIAHKILHIVQSPKSSVQDISKVVKVDQSLVSKVLFAVQALGFFSFFSQPVLPPQVKKIINIKNLKIEPILRQMNKELAMNAKLFDSPYADSEIFKESLQKISYPTPLCREQSFLLKESDMLLKNMISIKKGIQIVKFQ